MPPSLPPVAEAQTLPIPASTDVAITPAKPLPGTTVPGSTWWKAPPNSKIRKTAMKIVAMRLGKFADADIAIALGLASAAVVRGYVHRAYKNGWLTEPLDDPKDQIEYEILHKVVRNMHEALDAPEDERRDKMTVEVAKGTIFKSFDQTAGATAQPMNVLAIKIQMPEGAQVAVREGTMGGRPAYLEGEVVGGKG